MKQVHLTALALAAMLGCTAAASAANSTFTYQGELKSNGNVANGTYAMHFSLWDADNGGAEIALPILVNSVDVDEGRFTVDLDFGAKQFGNQVWLEINVDGTTLAPRQQFTAAPYSIQTRGIHVDESASFVGIGRTTQITGSEIFGVYRPTAGWGGMYMQTDSTGRPFYGYSAGGDVDAFHYFDGLSGRWTLDVSGPLLTVDGLQRNVGINEAEPDAALHVAAVDQWIHPLKIVNDEGEPVLEQYNTGSLLIGAKNSNCALGISPSGDNISFWHHDSWSGFNMMQLRGNDTVTFTNGVSMGIGTSAPAYTLHVNGTAGKPGGGSWSNASDVRLKKNVAPLVAALENLLTLQGVTFEYIDPAAIDELPGTQIGMIAQDVEQTFPQWVDEGPDGYKRVTFRGFEALAIEALRELRAEKDAEIASLRAEKDEQINQLSTRINELESLVAQLVAGSRENK